MHATMKVRDVMSFRIAACAPYAPLSEVAKLLWDHDCGIVPVLDEGARPVGVVTDRDLCMAAYTQGRRLDEIPVRRVMAKDVAAVSVAADALDAASLMAARQVRRLVVLDDAGALVGVVSLADLVSEKAVSDRVAVATLRDVCRPRVGPAREVGDAVSPAAENVRRKTAGRGKSKAKSRAAGTAARSKAVGKAGAVRVAKKKSASRTSTGAAQRSRKASKS
jgi:CBS domain-containing protein